MTTIFTAAPTERSAAADRLLDRLMKAACLLPLVLLVCLFTTLAVIGSARAEEACAGRDLMAEWRSSDPAAVAAVEKEAAAIPNGKGIFWKIEKPGIPASYLLGTMHVTDPRVLAMPNGAMEAKSGAHVIVVESDEILNEQQAMAKILAKPGLTMMTDGKTIQSYLPADDVAKLEAGLKARGIPLAAVSRMQPWMLSSFIALPACELARKAEGASFLDKKIAEDAARAGKPVKGLETMEEQLSAMASIPTG